MIKLPFGLALLSALLLFPGFSLAEPALPAGLEAESSEPSLPAGLNEPSLPAGLGETEEEDSSWDEGWGEEEASSLPFELSGFAESRFGARYSKDPYEDRVSLAEARVQFQAEKAVSLAQFRITGDFVADFVEDEYEVDLETGQGFFDLREAWASVRPLSFLDLKLGRQILTWGLGDLVFLNDVFPKDWNSFLIGRDLEYLKAPSDAVKASIFSDFANLDIVLTPRFDPDRFVDGRRVSFFNGALGRRSGEDAIVEVDLPDDWFSDEELALRLYRNLGQVELAAYYYNGFWKSPGGFNPMTGRAFFPALSIYGASFRSPLWKGIVSGEFALYDSRKDRSGDSPFINNSEVRALAAYEQELLTDFIASVQWYLEHMLDYDEYRTSLPPGSAQRDESRHVISLRLTKLLMRQNLTLSLMTLFSPTDVDAHIRPRAAYKVSDAWLVEAGAAVFVGEDETTFYNQFEKNSSVYTAVRYSF